MIQFRVFRNTGSDCSENPNPDPPPWTTRHIIDYLSVKRERINKEQRCNLLHKSLHRDAAKSYLFIGPATERGGGKGLATRKKYIFLKI